MDDQSRTLADPAVATSLDEATQTAETLGQGGGYSQAEGQAYPGLRPEGSDNAQPRQRAAQVFDLSLCSCVRHRRLSQGLYAERVGLARAQKW